MYYMEHVQNLWTCLHGTMCYITYIGVEEWKILGVQQYCWGEVSDLVFVCDVD